MPACERVVAGSEGLGSAINSSCKSCMRGKEGETYSFSEEESIKGNFVSWKLASLVIMIFFLNSNHKL